MILLRNTKPIRFICSMILCNFMLLAPILANADDLKLVSSDRFMITHLNETHSAKYAETGLDQLFYLEIRFSEEQTPKFHELLHETIGRHIAIVLNNYWVAAPRISSKIRGAAMDISINEHLKTLNPAPENDGELLFFLVDEEHTLRGDENLPEIRKSNFSIPLDDTVINNLCKSSHIYLFENDYLIAKSEHCEENSISFQFLKQVK